ncbi:MAG: hypothetical protein GY801_36615 [bacterium]|nr:hypothetical protein [bacterium]
MHCTNFYQANLTSVSFQGADLERTNFSDAILQYADFNDAIVTYTDNTTQYPKKVEHTKREHTRLEEVIWDGSDLTSISISRELLTTIPDEIRKKYEGTFHLPGSDTIIHSIEFPPEYKEAGISILSYFSTILNQKYVDIKVKVQIIQDGLKVKMIIETEEGACEQIEKTLEEYGLVVRGHMRPYEFLSDPSQIWELKNQLKLAQSQIESKQELLAYANSNTEFLKSQLQQATDIIGHAIQSSIPQHALSSPNSTSISISTEQQVQQLQENNQGGKIMEDKRVKISVGDNANIGGNFVIADRIKDSFNKVDSTDIDKDFKEVLKELIADVNSMIEQLPKEQAEQVAKDLQTLTNEAISKKPRRKWWELSADGIKEAAKTVGDIGLSVLKNLDKIIPMLENL